MHEGGCLCGKVRYSVDREPDDVINCSCTFCRRATGSAYLVETMFPKERLTVTSGEPRTYDHVSDGSGKTIQIYFCENCGTKLYMAFEPFPASVGVFSGTFDNTNWFARDVENCLYFFLREAQDGTVLPANAHVYNAHYKPSWMVSHNA